MVASRVPDSPGAYVERDGGSSVCSILKKLVYLAVVVCLAVGLILVICFAVLSKRKSDQQFDSKDGVMVPSCGDGWIRYHNKCFNVSVAEGSWTTANDSCTFLYSFLAVIEDQDDLNFMIQHKGPVDRWIGLEKQKGERWKWVDGSAYDPWFEIKGRSNCAYLNHQVVSSARCSAIRHWICSKRDKYK